MRRYDICLHVVNTCTFTQFVRTILVSLRSVSLYVTRQHFSVCKQVRRFISLVFSTFLRTLAHLHDIVLVLPRFSVCYHICMISLHLAFLCTLVCSCGISLVLSTFICTLVRYQMSHLFFSVIYRPTVIVQFVHLAFFRALHTFLWNQFCLIMLLRKLVVAYFISLSVSSTCLCILVC